MPRKPPEALKPASLWSRVFRVSRGNRATSTAVPAIPPALNILSEGIDYVFFLGWGKGRIKKKKKVVMLRKRSADSFKTGRKLPEESFILM
ncbi:hypothetical protein E2C01_054126 [Portunus trituberculatus]|uniref:Uncharacterized protein n=1 Tax=Portunus trituberculatus TaxID=210409 RepID=A0A5B7GR65_PORTR|nr:hypothetical protein [Portunus trituberculatus]